MPTSPFTDADLRQMQAKGIDPAVAAAQLDRFRTGFPALTVVGAARPGRHIMVLTPPEEAEALERWSRYLADGGEVCKFVPASGAASRMFKALYEYAGGDSDELPAGSPVAGLVASLARLPFRDDLDRAVARMYGDGLTAAALRDSGRNRDLIRAIIAPEGMNYGELPKALLKFHDYGPEGARTPLEEQLDEGADTAAAGGRVNLHFTVSAAHRERFEKELARAVADAEKRTGLTFNVGVSEQKPSTDTLAANPDNTPFRQPDGSLLFRPGGHGALISNLNDIDSAVVFIKNIDNVVPAWHRADTVRYKKVLGGLLLLVHDQMAAYAGRLRRGGCSRAELDEMADFCQLTLSTTRPGLSAMPDAELASWLGRKLNRPLRVCGMVRNEGEPGGGPYIAVDPDGSEAPQVLESTQIDTSKPELKAMMESATHFNPVDLACYIKDYDGRHYDLPSHVDPATGFISSKSSHGRELKAMELPGLWNGAMSDWATVFVEVPISTFNPVKTVFDLLRPMHLPADEPR